MTKSLAKIYIHIVFSTKNREPLLASTELRSRLFQYITKICTHHHCQLFAVNGVNDHVHLLLSLHRTITISRLIEEIKSSTSKWIKSTDPSMKTFYWQTGYGAFSISQSNFDAVINYIKQQEAHHKKFSFKDELRTLLKVYNVDYDEEILWT